MARKRPGIYAALSAYYFDDVAIMEAGEAAELLYVRLLAYASRQPQMEGFIPRLVVMSRLGIDPDQGGDAISRAERLADCGLLERCEGGYVIRSWGRWNKTAAELGIESAKDRVCKPRRTHASPAPVAAPVPASMPTPTPAPVPVAPVSVPVSVSVVGTYKTHKTPTMTQATPKAALEPMPEAMPETALEVMPEAMPEREVVAEPIPEAGSWPEADALIQEWEQQAQTEALDAENDTEPEAVAETVAPTPAPAPVVSAPSPVSVSGSAPPPPDIETASDGTLLKVRKRRRPARPLPEDWEPHDKHKEWAEQHRLDLAHEVFQFTNHAKANDRRQADWDAAFYTWLGKAYPRHTSRATTSTPPPARASASASVSDRIRGWQEAGQQLIHQATHQPTPELMMIGDSA